MVTLETLNKWLIAPSENENLEFKEAKQQFDSTKLMRYCVALANEKGGYLVFGVTDKATRRVVGTQAFSTTAELNKIKEQIVQKLRIRVKMTELNHAHGRVLVFEIPSRPDGQALDFDGAYLMRAGEGLMPMTPDQLRRIFAEGQPDWFSQYAKENASADEVVALLDTQTYFDLLKLPYPTTREGVLERLSDGRLIVKVADGWTITNLAAILLAKKLQHISPKSAAYCYLRGR
jgi:ATP-dependent DNA helicase RecG